LSNPKKTAAAVNYFWGLKIITAIIIIVFFLYDLFFIQDYYNTPKKDQFSQAILFLLHKDKELDKSVIIARTEYKECFDYYLEQYGSAKRVSFAAGVKSDIKNTGKFLSSTSTQYIWYICGHTKADNDYVEYLKTRLEMLLYNNEYINMEIWLFRKS
ncbi:MAG: hypothetical protein HY738_18890, partial [Bacteroidia bacterium]|nr:hypothetical protein [Bacteroidia bacterium]